MLTLNDGRSELWQWDTGRTLTVDADCSQVHFSNKVFGRSIDVDVVDGVAIVPDILLQTDKDLNVWAFVGTAENGYTKISKTFKVNRRNKPADYVFTPPEQTSLEEIKEKIEYLESIQDPDAIKNAVDEYLANNPIQIDEKDPTVPDWAKQTTKPKYTATEVGAVAKVNGVKPDANGNVEITIPDSGGNVAYDEAQKLTDEQKAQARENIGILEPLIGKADDIKPREVLAALQEGRDIVITYTDGTYGDIEFTGFSHTESSYNVTATCIIRNYGNLLLLNLSGQIALNIWTFNSDILAKFDDIAGGRSLGITGATVGQTVKISTVDENGVPTAWESVDFPSGGGGGSLHNPEFITAFSITEDGVKSVEVINGEVEYREVYIFFNIDGNCIHSQVTENTRSFGIINDDWRVPLGDCATAARAKYMHFNYMGIAEVTHGISIASFGGYPTFDYLIGFNPPYEGKVLPYKPIKKVELGLMADASYFAKDLHISVYGVRL